MLGRAVDYCLVFLVGFCLSWVVSLASKHGAWWRSPGRGSHNRASPSTGSLLDLVRGMLCRSMERSRRFEEIEQNETACERGVSYWTFFGESVGIASGEKTILSTRLSGTPLKLSIPHSGSKSRTWPKQQIPSFSYLFQAAHPSAGTLSSVTAHRQLILDQTLSPMLFVNTF